MSTPLPDDDKYFYTYKDAPSRPIISDKSFELLMNALKFTVACATIGTICWINPQIIWGVLVLVAVVFLMTLFG